MKKFLLIMCACLMGALSGAKAYTTADLTTAGWTLTTSLDDIASNVYVFVDAGAQETAVVRGAAQGNRPRYNTLSNPVFNKQEVWTIEKYGDSYAISGIEDNYYFSSGDAGWNDGMTNGVDGNKGLFTFNLSGEKYDIRSVAVTGDDNYMGHWNNKGEGVNISDNDDWSQGDGMEDIAVNKAYSNAPGYRLYKMAKSDYLQKYLTQNPNLESPVDVSYLIINSKIYQSGAAKDLPIGWNLYGNHGVDEGDGRYTESTGDTHLFARRTASGYTQEHTLQFDYYQSMESLPGGSYKSKANTLAPESDYGKAYFYILTTETPKTSTQMSGDNGWSSGKDETPSAAANTGSSLNIGIEANFKFRGGGISSTHTSIAGADDFELLLDPYLSTMAAELPADGAMTSGLWYHFNVAAAGKYVIAATALNDIIYATGSTTALSAAGSNKFTAVKELEAGDYYVRSSSANALTVTPCISTVAAELPANGEMTANDWYYFDIATASRYDFVANSLGNIVYTTDGDLAEDAIVENHFAVEDNELSATRYYVKSSSAQTLQWFISSGTDLTSIIKNPSFETGDKTDWTDDSSTDDKFFVQNNADFSKKQGTYYAERYWWDNTSDINQTTPELPAGIYRITAAAMDNAASPTFKLYAKAGSSDEVTQTVGAADDYSVEVSLKTAGTIKLGFKGEHTHAQWVAVDNFRLTYVGPYHNVIDEGDTQTYEGLFIENVVVTPTAEYPIVDISGATFTGTLTANFASNQNGFIIATAEQKAALGDVKNVVVGNGCDNFVLTDGLEVKIPAALTSATTASYDRSVANTNVYGTICLPFNVESNSYIQFYTVEEVDGTNNVLKLETTDAVAAGVPAVYKNLTANATKIEVATNNATVVAAAGTQGTDPKLVGTFTGETVSGANVDKCYYLKGNLFWQGNENFTIPAYRAYIQTDVNAEARLTIRIDGGDPTAISAIEAAEEGTLKDGKCLINNKVVLVKNGVKYGANGQKLN